MDADTRHQLKTNELADALNRLNDKRLGFAAVALVVIVIAYIGYNMLRSQQQQAAADGWHTLAGINTVFAPPSNEAMTQLRDLIERGNEGLSEAAHLKLGLMLKRQAAQLQDATIFQQALTELQSLADNPKAAAIYRAAALYNVGMLHEDQREFDAAEKAYRTLGDSADFAGSPFQDMAAVRLDRLSELGDPVAFEPGRAPIEMPPTVPPSIPPTSAPALTTTEPTPTTSAPAETPEMLDDAGDEALTPAPETPESETPTSAPTSAPESDAPETPAADQP